MRSFTTARDITPEECHWLDETVPAGKTVFEYTDNTYGCISPAGIAVSDEPHATPFYELPRTALDPRP
jgi:hypothetical protein